MFIKKYGDFAVGIFFAVLGAAGLFMACNFSEPVIQVAQAIGSRFMPKMISVIMLVFAALLIISSVLKLKHGITESVEEEETEGEEVFKPEYNRVAASLTAFSVYVLLMDVVGFLIMSVLYLPLQIYMLAPEEKQDKKHMVTYVLIGVACSLIIYFTFVYGFKIVLPDGLL